MPRSDTFVSVVTPLRNDADIVEGFVTATMAVLEANYSNYELVLVDDGSRDDTVAVVDGLLRVHKCIRLIRLSREFGVETAITAGLDSVIGDFTVVMLPDGDPPELIPDMVERARRGRGVVCGVRTSRPTSPLWAKVGAALFHSLASRLVDVEIPRNASSFQVLARSAVNGITRIKDKHRSLLFLSGEVGYDADRVEYAPRFRRPKARHRGFSESLALAIGVVVSRSTRPLRIVAGLALAASTLNLLYMGYVITVYIFKAQVAEGWTTTSLQLSSMFFLLFLVLTVLAEYVGRILEESKDRPLYHVLDERNSNVSVADAERRNVVKESVVG